jgi:hypothetical protein
MQEHIDVARPAVPRRRTMQADEGHRVRARQLSAVTKELDQEYGPKSISIASLQRLRPPPSASGERPPYRRGGADGRPGSSGIQTHSPDRPQYPRGACGLDLDVCRLFIVDGAKAMRKVSGGTFGARTPIQRQIHKDHNVFKHLTKPLAGQ